MSKEKEGARAAPGELRRKVYRLLGAEPSRDWTASEAHGKIGHSTGAIANALESLASQGLARQTGIHPRRYRLAVAGDKRRVEVMKHIIAIAAEGGPLSSREVMRRMGRNDDRIIRKDWDDLAAAGKVPPRPLGPYAPERVERWRHSWPDVSGLPAGAILFKTEPMLRAFTEQVQATAERDVPGVRQTWERQLEVLEGLIAAARRAVTGMDVDEFIDSVLGASEKKEGER